VAQVDPDDDDIVRFVVWHYRFDAERRERRNVVVAAFDDDEEFRLDLQRRAEELRRLKDQDEADEAERVGGVILEPGAKAEAQSGRTILRAVRAAARAAGRK
jgi:hypothetical protein